MIFIIYFLTIYNSIFQRKLKLRKKKLILYFLIKVINGFLIFFNKF